MKIIRDKILFVYKFLLRGYKASSNSYVNYLRKIGVRIGKGCKFHDPATTFIDTDKPYMISIGDNVQITRGVNIVAHGYDWIVLKNKFGGNYGSAGEIVIGNNVFIGMNSTILKNVKIGNNVIIGAGSVVTKSIPDNCVAVGVPAKKVMDIEEYLEKIRDRTLSEAVSAFLHSHDRKVFNKRNWEFEWIYNSKCDQHLFSNYDEFSKFCFSKAMETTKD